MLYIAVTVLSIVGTLFGLAFLRFRAGAPPVKEGDAPSLLRGYAGWLGDGARALFDSGAPAKMLALYKTWVLRRYAGWRQWIFVALATSFGFCAASGFLFAVFRPSGDVRDPPALSRDGRRALRRQPGRPPSPEGRGLQA